MTVPQRDGPNHLGLWAIQGIPPWVENFGKTTTDHEISHIGFDAAYRARYCVYAPIITRSRPVELWAMLHCQLIGT